MDAESRKRRGLLSLRGQRPGLSSFEEARRRMHNAPGFFSSLTPEAKATMLAYDGPENLGPDPYED
jgi:hypothetical protein